MYERIWSFSYNLFSHVLSCTCIEFVIHYLLHCISLIFLVLNFWANLDNKSICPVDEWSAHNLFKKIHILHNNNTWYTIFCPREHPLCMYLKIFTNLSIKFQTPHHNVTFLTLVSKKFQSFQEVFNSNLSKKFQDF